jgi:hypothetical protein
MLLGRLFHSVDAALSNYLSPNVFVRTLGFDGTISQAASDMSNQWKFARNN